MGKYSIKEYMKYPMTVVRFSSAKESEQYIPSIYTHTILFWKDIEIERGVFEFKKVLEVLMKKENHMIEFQMEPPVFASKETEKYQISFISKMASILEDQDRVIGIYITGNHVSHAVYETFAQAFCSKPIILDIFDQKGQDWFRDQEHSFGLLLYSMNENLLDVGEVLARRNLTRVWEKNPIFIENTPSDSVFQKNEIVRWRGRFSRFNSTLGPLYELRRVTYPKECSSLNYLPMRIWMVNRGTSPNYDHVRFQVRLKQKGSESDYILVLKEDTSLKKMGDLVQNEILQLPELTAGTYEVFLGLFNEKQISVPLNISKDCSEGYYLLGEIAVLDQGELDYERIWDDFYPEGYYPLEDPQAPDDDHNEE